MYESTKSSGLGVGSGYGFGLVLSPKISATMEYLGRRYLRVVQCERSEYLQILRREGIRVGG